MSQLQFHLLNVPMPPMLPKMVGVRSSARYFSICYYGSKATWSDGRNLATFNYYGVYNPLISHLALALDLSGFDLGSDDQYPTHNILFDREENKIYVGEYQRVAEFLDTQHPPTQPISLTAEELEELKLQVEAEFGSFEAGEIFDVEEMQKMGLFELFTGPSESQRQDTVALISWLDKYIDADLVDKYINAANQGNGAAYEAISRFKDRVILSQQLN